MMIDLPQPSPLQEPDLATLVIAELKRLALQHENDWLRLQACQALLKFWQSNEITDEQIESELARLEAKLG